MRFAIIVAVIASALALASPVQEVGQSTEMTQVQAMETINQFAAANQMTQAEAIDLLKQYVAENGVELSEQDAQFLPFLASIAAPFIAKGVGALVKKIAPGTAPVVDKITGFLG